MRRVFASLLVVLVSFSLIAPAVFASTPESKVPACCLRNGNHHCTGKPSESESGPAVRSGKCLLFPSASAVPATDTAGLPEVSRVILTGFFNAATSILPTDSLSLISYSQAGQKRGPPVFFS